MKYFRRFLSLAITLILLISCLSISSFVSYAETEGICGDNLTWRYSPASGVLTILGEGEMYDYRTVDSPWAQYASDIKTIVLGSGITSIGQEAFDSCTGLVSVKFPSTLTKINNYAFAWCTSLKSVVIPDNVTDLEYGVFYHCTSLEKAVIGKGVTEIKYYTFSDCTALYDVQFSDSMAVIGEEAFYGCSSYENIILPDQFVELSYESFLGTGFYANEDNWDNGGLYIGEYFLYGNKTTNGTFVIRPGTKYVARYALYDLQPGTIYYPRTIEKINEPVVYVYHFGASHVPYDSPYVIGFSGSPVSGGTRRLCPPEGKSGENTYYKFDETGTVLTFYGNDAIKDYEEYYEDGYFRLNTPWEYIDTYIDEVVIEEGITSIGTLTFPYVKKATLADSITHIYSYAIRGSFTSLKLPKNLEYICPTNYVYTTKLEEITISEDNPNFTAKDGVLYSKDMKMLIKYPCAKQDEHFSVPDTVTALDPNAFNDLKTLKTLYIPETVTEIDNISKSSGVTIQCKLNSAAHIFAKANNVPYEIICDHSFTNYTVTPPTCFNDGYKLALCDKGCGASDKIVDEGSATGHSFVNYIYNEDATCTEDGTSTAVCENGCLTIDTRTEEGSAFGHIFTDYTVVITADCTQDEVRESFCDRGCGGKTTVTVEGSALGHTFTDYTEDNNADCTHDGTKTAVCNVCGASDTVIIEGSALGHSFTEYTVNNNATCTENGVKTALCDNGCGEKDIITEEAQGHTVGEWIVIEEPDYGFEGYKIQNCTVCSEVVNTETIPALVYEGFPDVPESAWYYEGVEYCFKQGYILGNDKGNFEPNNKLTREQFVVILARISGAKLSEYTENPFTDVKADSWYGASVIWASENGYVNGVGNGRFGVGEAMTRETVAVMLHRYSRDEGVYIDVLDSYSDCQSISTWAETAMNWAITNKILGSTSTSKPTLSPQMTLTRAQAAKIFMSYDAYITK